MNRRRFFQNLGMGAILSSPLTLASGETQEHGIESLAGAGRFLLLDDRIVERVEDVSPELGKVIKEAQNPLFVEDKPWEVWFNNLYPNVLFDEQEQIFKCWYNPFIVDEAIAMTPPEQRKLISYSQAAKGRSREIGVCYATSKDGIVWNKPELGIIDFKGSRQNNLVARGAHGAGIWKDLRDPQPARRFKMFFLDQASSEGSHSHMAVAFSPDGLHWSKSIGCEPIQARGDTHNNTLWAESLGEYVGITRLWEVGVRVVGRCESHDFLNWTPAVRCLAGDEKHQTYAMLVFPYASVYLALVMMFHTESDLVDCELAWSLDTVRWKRICPGTPLIPRGPQGSQDWGCIYAAAYPILNGNEIRLYYGGSDGPHTNWRRGSFCLARLGKDKFCGLRPSGGTKVGTVVTKPILCTGKHLRVSADAAGGSLRVGVLGAEPFNLEACRRIATDVTDYSVEWKDTHTLGALKGRQIRLCFEMQASKIYAFAFAD